MTRERPQQWSGKKTSDREIYGRVQTEKPFCRDASESSLGLTTCTASLDQSPSIMLRVVMYSPSVFAYIAMLRVSPPFKCKHANVNEHASHNT